MSRSIPFTLLAAALAAVSSAAPPSPAPAAALAVTPGAPPLPPPEHQRLAREILQELIETDTTPAAGTARAAELVAARLRAAGFPAEDVHVLGPRPDRVNVVARLRGTGAGRPILFLSHLDVVDARLEDWSVEPFKLTEQDGYFYGRGTLDIKGEVADLVANFVRLKREGYRPERDLVLALTADEEGGDANGAAWLLAERRELIDAAYVINTDAGGGQMVGPLAPPPTRKRRPTPPVEAPRRLRLPVQTSEKLYVTFQLEAAHAGGHSSLPPRDNAIYRLAAGLARFARFEFPVRLTETTRAWFERLAQQETGETRDDMLAVARRPPDPAAAERLARRPLYNASMRTTCVATQLDGGHAENALPQRARAVLQCRLLPGDDAVQVGETIQRYVADADLVLTFVQEPLPPAPDSPVDPAVFGPIERVTQELWPGVLVLPAMDPWSTDGAHFRRAGVPVYGVSGIFFDIDDVRSHGRDERVGVQEFYAGVEFMYRLIQALGGGR